MGTAGIGTQARDDRGFSLVEMVLVAGVVGLLAAVTIPPMQAAVERNRIITGAELLAAQIRQARLTAITRNAPVRVRFNCPGPGGVRVLAVTGNPAIDNAADRCLITQPDDSPAVYAPAGVAYGAETPPTLQINSRGQVSTVGGGNLPLTIPVSYGETSRTVTVTATGRITTPAS